MPAPFVHLQVHSEYSLADGLVRIDPLAAASAGHGAPAVALTDLCNLFALVKFYSAAQRHGVKPLVGAELLVANPEAIGVPDRLAALVMDDVGYHNLTELLTRMYREGQQSGTALLHRDWLDADSGRGLILLSGGVRSDVGRALLTGQTQMAEQRAAHWARLFPDRYYMQVSRTGREHEEACLHASVDLAAAMGLPLVATNDVRFIKPEDFEAHEVRVCIHDGRTLDDPRRERRYSREQYLRSPQEMAELFSDLPEALANTVEIAKRCNLELDLGNSYLPDFPLPEGETVDSHFRAAAQAGLDRRLARILDGSVDDEARQPYQQRLETELQVILQMGFPGYFLIVADFIQWAKDNGIPVGPGRGSGAGSLVAYALNITDLDPLEHELLFERFLNPERVSMPDFDIDFCMDNRDRVIHYVAGKYGRDAVAQIITFGSMAARAVVRDVGRVLGYPYGFTDRVAKMVPFEIGMTLDKALEDSDDLRGAYTDDDDVHQLIDMSLNLEGLARNPGKHAGGVVIAPGKLTEFTPLYCEADGSNLVTQFDKDDVERVGLVKFDFLGLRTLTIIDWALNTVNAARRAAGEAEIDIDRIPMDDEKAFELLKTGRSTAVFQLESGGMQQLIRKLRPDSFDDVTALVALYRPGPLQSGMVDDFVARKHGTQRVTYPHPDLESILKPTYGVILYQEQVMQIAQVLAGYSLGEADLLRRAMGKKKPEEMARQRTVFLSGATGRGINEKTANSIFDLMEKFAGYGFNKSHSVAYALLAYQTLWLKAHFPVAFMAAVLSADMDNTDKVVHLIGECRAMGLEIETPDVNRSEYMFTCGGEGSLLYGLGAIKGVGESAIDNIVSARRTDGVYANLFDFCARIDPKRVNRRVIEALVRAGALDGLGVNRASLMHDVEDALRLAEHRHADLNAGQEDLFGLDAAIEERHTPATAQSAIADWDEDVRLRGEKDSLGLYLSGHPMDFYAAEIAALGLPRFEGLGQESPQSLPRGGRGVEVAALLVSVVRRKTQRGMMASLQLDDGSGRMEATLFSEGFERYRDLLQPDQILVVRGNLVADDFRGGVNIRVESLETFEHCRAERASCLELDLRQPAEAGADDLDLGFVDRLSALLEPSRGGGCRIRIRYRRADSDALISMPDNWRVRPTDDLLRRLDHLSENGLKVVYGRQKVRPPESALAI